MNKIANYINKLIEERGYDRYCEISPVKDVFDSIECEKKIHIESDKEIVDDFKKRNKFDVVFIDGEHSYQDVKRDYDWALSRLRDGGVIIFDDVNPPTQWHMRSKQEYKYPEEWCGQAKHVFDEIGTVMFNDDEYEPKKHVRNESPWGLGVVDFYNIDPIVGENEFIEEDNDLNDLFKD